MHLPLRRERVVECLSRRLDPGATTDDECRGECGGRRMDDLVPPVHRYLHSLATRNLTSLFRRRLRLRATRSRSGQTGNIPVGHWDRLLRRSARRPVRFSAVARHSHARMTSHGSRSATASATRRLRSHGVGRCWPRPASLSRVLPDDPAPRRLAAPSRHVDSLASDAITWGYRDLSCRRSWLREPCARCHHSAVAVRHTPLPGDGLAQRSYSALRRQRRPRCPVARIRTQPPEAARHGSRCAGRPLCVCGSGCSSPGPGRRCCRHRSRPRRSRLPIPEISRCDTYFNPDGCVLGSKR